MKIKLLSIFVFFVSYCYAETSPLQYFVWNPLGNALFQESKISLYHSGSESLHVSMLLDQTEPISFILTNPSNQDIIIKQIKVIDKSASANSMIYDFNIVKQWYMGSQTTIKPTLTEIQNPKLTPELLLKDDNLVVADKNNPVNYLRIIVSGKSYYQDISNPLSLMPNAATSIDATVLKNFAVNANSGKQVWLNITTNEHTTPNIYNLFIKATVLINKQVKSIEIPLTIEVLPVSLVPSPLNYSIYYVGQIRKTDRLLSAPKSRQQYIAELKDLKSHGVLYPTQYLDGDNESAVADYIKIRADLGFPCDKMYFINGFADAGISSVQRIESNFTILKKAILKNTSCKDPRIYVYGIDEAKESSLLRQKVAWQAIHKLGGNVFAASYSDDMARNNMVDYLDTLVNASITRHNDLIVMRRLNKDVYLYSQPQSGIPNPFIYRKNYGYYLIKNDYTGAMPFAYQFGFPEHMHRGDLTNGLCYNSESSYCSVWSNFDNSAYYNHMFTYPTSDGVIDTVQWEGYAAAITDTRYYYTLVDLMKTKCKKSDIRCNFDPMSLINVNDPAGTRHRILEKIKLFVPATNN